MLRFCFLSCYDVSVQKDESRATTTTGDFTVKTLARLSSDGVRAGGAVGVRVVGAVGVRVWGLRVWGFIDNKREKREREEGGSDPECSRAAFAAASAAGV